MFLSIPLFRSKNIHFLFINFQFPKYFFIENFIFFNFLNFFYNFFTIIQVLFKIIISPPLYLLRILSIRYFRSKNIHFLFINFQFPNYFFIKNFPFFNFLIILKIKYFQILLCFYKKFNDIIGHLIFFFNLEISVL